MPVIEQQAHGSQRPWWQGSADFTAQQRQGSACSTEARECVFNRGRGVRGQQRQGSACSTEAGECVVNRGEGVRVQQRQGSACSTEARECVFNRGEGVRVRGPLADRQAGTTGRAPKVLN
jgi:hypothetical protein